MLNQFEGMNDPSVTIDQPIIKPQNIIIKL